MNHPQLIFDYLSFRHPILSMPVLSKSLFWCSSHWCFRRFADKGLPDGSINLNLTGTGGQSFCAFMAKGISVTLEGDANDYVGKVITICHLYKQLFCLHGRWVQEAWNWVWWNHEWIFFKVDSFDKTVCALLMQVAVFVEKNGSTETD